MRKKATDDSRSEPARVARNPNDDTLKVARALGLRMEVTVDVAGGATHEVDLPADATYADLLSAVDLGPNEAAVVVDGRPVPEDRTVAVEHVEVLRLIRGG